MASTSSTQMEGRVEVMDQPAWVDLPPELLKSIADLLDPLDRVAVRLVCASWRACVREYFPDLSFEIPRLLIGRDGELTFFSLQREKILPCTLSTRPRGGRCCGHVAGWLGMAFDCDRSISLCNPLSGRSVGMPQPPVFPVKKVIFSAPPTSPGWVAAVLGRTGTMVAVLQHGMGGWMSMGIEEAEQHGGFVDMAFWSGGRLCALCHDGAVFAFRVDPTARTAVVSQLRDLERVLGMLTGSWWQLYLLELEGELLLVRKLYISLANNGEVEWDVQVKVLTSPETRCWEPVTGLPRHTLFVGAVVSVAVPFTTRQRESFVYFARREVEMMAPHAISRYSLELDDIQGVPIPGGHNVDVEPVWITPFV